MMTENEIENAAPVPDSGREQLWPMGAVTRRTGIGEHTLRAWERRFGFPKPHRLASGHRRYPASQVSHLILIARALDAGYRAGDIVSLPKDELDSLLFDAGVTSDGAGPEAAGESIELALDACLRFDREGLAGLLQREAAVQGTRAFLRELVAPLLDRVGEEWSRGRMGIRHEHFFSEVLEDQLRALRAAFRSAPDPRPVILASLPRELHALGLQMAALEIAAAGRPVRVLGPNLPAEEIAQAAVALDAAAVGLSISIYSNEDETKEEIVALREALPKGTALWLGGAGAADLGEMPGGVSVTTVLDDLERALAGLVD